MNADITRRTEDPGHVEAKAYDWTLTVSICLVAVLLTILVMWKIQPSRERYQLERMAAGMVARLDKQTGEVVILGPTGKIIGTQSPGADPYAGIATPAKDSARNP